MHNQLSVVRALVENGAKLNKLSSHFHATPLFLAISLKNEKIATYLIEKGADVNYVVPEIMKEFNKNTLDILPAAYCCIRPQVLKAKTIDEGLRPISLAKNISILHLAAMVGCSEQMITLLLEKGADRSSSAFLIGRSVSEHMYQNFCTSAGISAQFLSLCNACGMNIADILMGLCRPGIHARAYMDSIPVDMPKQPWELAKDFHHSERIVEALKPSPTILYTAAAGAGAGTGEHKEHLLAANPK